jgi:hypothetical protein
MKKIFVAGAYNGSNIIECLDNIKRGLRVCAYLLSNNYIPFCPWTDFLFHLVSGSGWTPTLEQYRNYCLKLIEMSDLVFVISGHGTHEGVTNEVRHATKHEIPVCFYKRSLKDIVLLYPPHKGEIVDDVDLATMLQSVEFSHIT